MTRALPLVLGTVGAGLTAGVFLAFATAVMPGLRGADDRTFVDVMQRVNVAIVNPVFLVVLLGPVVALGLAVALGPARASAGAALVLHVVTLAITIGVNIPLNDALAAADLDAATAARAAFERRWNAAHLVRTLTATAALACGLVAARVG